MGERSIIEIADALASGMDVKDITFIDGTVFKTKDRDIIYDAIELPDYDVIKEDKREFARSFYIQYCNTDPFCAKRLVEPYDNSSLWCRIHRKSHCRRMRWMRYMHSLI